MNLTVDISGCTTIIDARDGWTVMEAIRDAGLPIVAQCGGGRACATCHVHIAPETFRLLPPMDADELDLLESSDTFDPERSRLGCQVVCSEALEALRVTLQPDSIES